MYPAYSKWIRSWRDLPLKLYQRANIFRYETKATRPLIRAREFYWLEAHDAFATKAEAANFQSGNSQLIMEYRKVMIKAYDLGEEIKKVYGILESR